MMRNNIRKFIAGLMLVAFTMPSTLAISNAYDTSYNTCSTVLPISTNTQLTNKNNKITLSLRDSDVRQVLRMFADKAGYNIVFHSSVGTNNSASTNDTSSSSTGKSSNGKITLDLVNTSVNEAFNLVLEVANLNSYKQGNTLIIIAKDSPDNALYSKQDMMIFPIKYVAADKIAAFLNKNVFSMKKNGMSAVDAATVNSATNELIVFGMPSDMAIVTKVIAQFDKEPITKTYTVSHTTPAEMANMICKMLLPASGIGSNDDSSSSTPSSSSSSSNDSMTGGAASLSTSSSSSGSNASDSIKLGEGVIACSTASQNASSSITPFSAQSLSVAYYTQRGTISIIGGSEAQANMIANFIKTNDVKQPQAMLEVQIIELTEAGSKEFYNQWYLQSKHWSASFDGQTFGGGRKGYRDSTYEATEYVGPFVTYDPDTGLPTITAEQAVTRHIANPFAGPQISWYMNYLIENKKGRVLANPKLMITNGQVSTIDTTQDYVEKVTSEYTASSSGSGYNSGVVERTYEIGDDLGIKVELTPFISPDGYVTLNIKPEYSTVASQVTVPRALNGQITNDLMATLLNKRKLDLKNLRIKDGETLVIGGMIQETEAKNVSKIPLLGDLPIIGAAFRSTSTSKSKNELIIMITPKIINDDGDIAKNL